MRTVTPSSWKVRITSGCSVDLVSLRSIALGRASLRFREYGDNTLVMRSSSFTSPQAIDLPSLTTFIGDGYNWERVDSLLLEHLPSLSPTSISFNTKFPHKPICTCIGTSTRCMVSRCSRVPRHFVDQCRLDCVCKKQSNPVHIHEDPTQTRPSEEWSIRGRGWRRCW